jgi:hypothetical protein
MNKIWCKNAIKISGDKDRIHKVAEFIRLAKERRRFFDLVYRSPKNIAVIAIIDWQKKNWGTKWDIDMNKVYFVLDEHFIEIGCETAETPPIEFFRKFASDYGVRVEIHYGAQFSYTGNAICEDGHVTLTHRGDSSL